MQINKEIIDELYNIPWFHNCGKQVPSQFGMRVDSLSAVKEHITSLCWENIVLEHQGDMTVKLCNRSCQGIGKEYQAWNNLVDDFKRIYLPQLETQWKSQLSLFDLHIKEVIDDVSFNVLGIVMADAYKEILPISDFYTQLLEIYKNGYLPCGWIGKKDKGCFIIY